MTAACGIPGQETLARVRRVAARARMVLLSKDHEADFATVARGANIEARLSRLGDAGENDEERLLRDVLRTLIPPADPKRLLKTSELLGQGRGRGSPSSPFAGEETQTEPNLAYAEALNIV